MMPLPLTISYDVAVDKNGDGFVGWDVNAADPANLIPSPVLWDQFNALSVNGTSPTRWLETPYGLRALQTSLNAGAAGVYLGRTGAGVADFTVSAGLTYTACAWVRAESDLSAVATTLTVYNQSLASRGSANIDIGTNWTQVSVTFTAQPGDTHITLALEKPAGSAAIAFTLTGIMQVVAGTAPAAFNAGDPVSEVNDVITPDVLSVDWSLGMRRPFDVTAAPTRARIILDNAGDRYAPEDGGVVLSPGTRVKVRAAYDGVTYPLIHGWVDHIAVDAGDLAGRRAVLHVRGPERTLDETLILFDLMLNVSPSQVLANICAVPPLNRLNTDFAPSANTFAYAGDTWGDGIRASRAVRQVVEADRGRFFSDRESALHYRNRAMISAYRLPDADLTNNVDALDYAYGDWLVNAVRVTVRPRSVGTPGSTLWTLSSAQPVDPGSANCRVIVARFRDSDGDAIGATDIITPVAGVDYSANTAADGSGADVTANFSLTLIDGGSASAANLQLCNTGSVRAYLLAGAKLRGTPLYQGDSVLIERRDEASIDAHDLHTANYNLPYFVTVAEATAMADAILTRQSRPFGVARELRLSNRAHPQTILARSLFDRVTVRDAGTGHAADYHIIAEEHHIDRGGARHRVTWLLEPTNPGGIWQLDQGKLGASTYLGL